MVENETERVESLKSVVQLGLFLMVKFYPVTYQGERVRAGVDQQNSNLVGFD